MKIEEFKKRLITELSNYLKKSAERFSDDEISVFDLGCFPWHGFLELSFLTSDEEYGDEKFEEIASWKYYAFNREMIKSPEMEALGTQIAKEYEASDSKRELGSKLIKTCAEVMNSEEVRSVLTLYKLSPDFKCTVFHPDDSDFINLCEEGI